MNASRPADPNLKTLSLSEQDGSLAQKVAETIRKKYRPALIVMSGDQVGTRITVEGNPIIGRDPASALPLSDPGVSWRHAMLEDQGGAFCIVDLGSRNGTHVNGEKVPRAFLRDGDKVLIGSTLVCFELQDETDAAYTEFVEQLIHVDDLTGLYLRRRFDAELATLMQNAVAKGAPLALLAMDLDGVKAINDAHGHMFGAYIIAESGKLIGRLVEHKGIATRFGGDEFVAALPGLGLAQATEFAERIRAGIAEYPFALEGIPLRPAISIGVSVYPEVVSAADPDELFRSADSALYEAKRSGKNRVCQAR